MLLSSASSKTAYGTAFMLLQRAGHRGRRLHLGGATRPSAKAWAATAACSPTTSSTSSPADAACVYVDFAGNADFRRRIHARFANLKYSCSVGGTHVEQLGGAKDLPGPRATLFFAPAQIKKRKPTGAPPNSAASW